MNVIIETIDGKIKKEFSGSIVGIGSAEDNNFIFDDRKNVSLHHLTIAYRHNQCFCYCHSFFQTYLNGKSFDKVVINEDALITIGQNGPQFTLSCNPIPVKQELSGFYKRWYDISPILTKAINLLQKAEDYNVATVTEFLNDVFNKFDKDYNYIGVNEKLRDIIKNLPNNLRWYDKDTTIQELIESIKILDDEAQQMIAIDIIKMLDCLQK